MTGKMIAVSEAGVYNSGVTPLGNLTPARARGCPNATLASTQLETFDILHKYNMKLNPEKCALRVDSGKFLGSWCQIGKSKSRPSRTSRRTISSGHRDLEELKQYLSITPLLHTSKADEQLYLYLAVCEVAISGVLVREEEDTQFSIYYASRTLGDAEKHYPYLEKLALALLSASMKLKPYFQCHLACVVTTYPLKNVMHKPELSGRLAKWPIEISGYDIDDKPRTAKKSQILADFIADFTLATVPKVDKELLLASIKTSGIWTLYTVGASNVKGSGLGVVLKAPGGDIIRLSIRTSKLTNNEAEYEAMIASLELARSLRAEIIKAKCYSLLLVNQVNRVFKLKDERMQKYLEKIQVILHRFREWTMQHVPREMNTEAEALANFGSLVGVKEFNSGTLVRLMKSAVESSHVEVNTTSLTWDYHNKYIDYLEDGKLPIDPKESRCLRTKAVKYCLINGKLYRRSFYGPLARHLGPGETDYTMRKVVTGCKELIEVITGFWDRDRMVFRFGDDVEMMPTLQEFRDVLTSVGSKLKRRKNSNQNALIPEKSTYSQICKMLSLNYAN
ncbi:uncharacterized protein LOC132048801 [Lycium ferocissimum]|uniref:uncharacterized protein LOC132048801 n=1 Tax=Lycium ferocissimum TaxID=112874 RepID=UPI00281676A7|nr:uncharacterized protein LOC132048801 [Lycium ferocissimum]